MAADAYRVTARVGDNTSIYGTNACMTLERFPSREHHSKLRKNLLQSIG
jgi:hypothetical protein